MQEQESTGALFLFLIIIVIIMIITIQSILKLWLKTTLAHLCTLAAVERVAWGAGGKGHQPKRIRESLTLTNPVSETLNPKHSHTV